MKKVNVKIKGTVPLLHNRFETEQHGNNKVLGKKKVYDPKEEADKLVYRDDKGMLCVPSEHILGALTKAATGFVYSGKKSYKDVIKSGIFIEPDMISLGKKNYDAIDTRGVVIQRARVVKWRPMFNNWEISFTVVITDDDALSPSTLHEIFDKAGTIGIGDYRPRFGRFQVTGFEEIKVK